LKYSNLDPNGASCISESVWVTLDIPLTVKLDGLSFEALKLLSA